MRILVTGGAGFIGVNLCLSLLHDTSSSSEPHQVICLDNFYTSREDNLKNLQDNSNFEFIHHDVCDPITIDDNKIDYIYHLACPASPVQYQRDPIYTAKINFLGTLNALELAKKHQAKILLASTSEIYGNPLEHPQSETYFGNVNTLGPRACYDEGKRISETLCCDFARSYPNFRIAIARIFNTYGPFMQANDGRVISNFIVQALQEAPLTLYGDGSQTRSFCHVKDTVKGLITLMNSNVNTPVNIGNPLELSVFEVAKTIKKLTKTSSKIEFKPLPQDDPLQRKPDISKAAALGWEPEISLQDGLVETIQYFRDTLK